MMATTSRDGLQLLLDDVGIPSQNLTSISADIGHDPLAIYHAHLADLLVQLTDCEHLVAYKSIVWAPDMTHMMVVTPRLRIRDVKPSDLAADLRQRVSRIFRFLRGDTLTSTVSAFRIVRTSHAR